MLDNKVLLICYYFPPMGGAGIGRPLSLFKHFHEHGIDCEVLTVKNVAYRFHEPELLDSLDKSKIYRAGSFDPQRIMYLMGMRKVKEETVKQGKVISRKMFPDIQKGWVRKAIKLGRTLTENKKYKAIISSSPPMSAHLVAMKLAKEFKIPWVADFRDYWVSYKVEDWFEDKKQVDRGKKLLDKIVTTADEVVTVSEDIAAYLKRGQVIHNSYDIDRAKLWETPKSDKFVIGLLGTFDNMTPIEPLFKLLDEFAIKSPELYKLIELCHVGNIKIPNIEELLKRYKLNDKFISYGLRNKNETVQLLNKTSLFYFGLSDGNTKGILTGRVFDILASGRPILASVPIDSEVASLIKSTQNGLCYTIDNTNEAIKYLGDKIKSFQNNTHTIRPLPEYALKFSSDNMTAKYAGLIKQLL